MLAPANFRFMHIDFGSVNQSFVDDRHHELTMG
jgi:hypothetical protein